MHIAQVAPLTEAIPPKLYGGTERVVSWLTEELIALGHEVTLLDGAVSGDTTAGGRARLDWALDGGADAAIVELGANDGLRGIDPKEMDANLTAILDALKARHIKVLFSGMYAPPNLGADYGNAFRAVFDRLGGRRGLGAWLSAPPTQTMQSVFRNHALQPDEILPLLAVIDDASNHSRPADTSSMAKFVLFGFSGMLVGLALLQLAWRGRFRSVRRTIVRAQVRGEQ